MTENNTIDTSAIPSSSLERAARAAGVRVVTYVPEDKDDPDHGRVCFFAYEEGTRTGVRTTDKAALRDQ